MNDLMSGGLHRLWKDAMVAWLGPPRRASRGYSVLDVAGGTGDIAFRIAERSEGAEIVVADINARDARGRPRAGGPPRARPTASPSSRRNAEDLPSPTTASTRSPSPSASATCRGSTGRSARLSRAEARRPLPLPRIFRGRRRRARPALRPLFLQRHSRARPTGRRRRRALPLSGRIRSGDSRTRRASPR